MKFKIILFYMLYMATCTAQNCDYSNNINDSLGTYKSTKDFLMHEKFFGLNKKFIYFSLTSENQVPLLHAQFIEKSNDFMKVLCFDKNSKLYIQLENGTIITLIHTNEINCGTTIKDQNDVKTRLNTGYFKFSKGSIEALKQAPVTLIRFKNATDTSDYIIKTQFTSEVDSQIYKPATYFMSYLRCID